MTTANRVVVLGGMGKTGRRVVERLQAKGVLVRALSRSTEPAFDWEKPETWAAALQNADAIYAAFQPDLAVPGADEAIRTLTEIAKASGVKKLVLLSGRGEPEAQHAEQIALNAGLETTIVSAAWFNQNFSENFLLDSVLAGELVLPVGDVREPFIDADDIADVAVAALTGDGHAGQIYEVTGPRLLTFKEALAEIAAATGREVRFTRVTPEQYSAMLAEYGLPEAVASLLNYLFTTIMDGRNESLTDGVQRALGRAPKDFADYAREAAASGAWDPQPVATNQ
jgi:uncharacterized protein YbjT (DUF2867 family)